MTQTRRKASRHLNIINTFEGNSGFQIHRFLVRRSYTELKKDKAGNEPGSLPIVQALFECSVAKALEKCK